MVVVAPALVQAVVAVVRRVAAALVVQVPGSAQRPQATAAAVVVKVLVQSRPAVARASARMHRASLVARVVPAQPQPQAAQQGQAQRVALVPTDQAVVVVLDATPITGLLLRVVLVVRERNTRSQQAAQQVQVAVVAAAVVPTTAARRVARVVMVDFTAARVAAAV